MSAFVSSACCECGFQLSGSQLSSGTVPLARYMTKRSMHRLTAEINDRMGMFDSGTGKGLRRRSSMALSRAEPFVFENIMTTASQPDIDTCEVQISVQVTPFMRSGGIIGHLKR